MSNVTAEVIHKVKDFHRLKGKSSAFLVPKGHDKWSDKRGRRPDEPRERAIPLTTNFRSGRANRHSWPG